MVTCECSVDETGGVTLVGAVCSTDTPGPRQVTLAARVDGPVWPPRRNGVPERTWRDGELTAVVPEGGRLAVGFATPGTAASPPVEVVESAPAETDDRSLVVDATPNGVVRALGDGRPPRDAVPEPTEPAHPESDSSDALPDQQPGSAARTADTGPSDADTGSVPVPTSPPPTVTAWLDAVERRLAPFERRSGDTDSGPDGATAAAMAGAAEALASRESQLRVVADRASALADRCAAATEGPTRDGP